MEDFLSGVLKFSERIEGFSLRPYQAQVVREVTRRLITGEGGILTNLWARKSGKSETIKATILALMSLLPEAAKSPSLLSKFPHLATFRDGFNVAIAGPKMDTAAITFKRIRRQGRTKKFVNILNELDLEVEVSNSMFFELSNGSMAQAFSGSETASSEGPDAHLLYLDEAQLLSPFSSYKILRPMVACVTGDTLIATDQGLFPMREIVVSRKDFKVLTFDKSGNSKFIRPTRGHIYFDAEIVEIKLTGMKKIRCSLTHPFWSRRRTTPRIPSFRIASELKVGDQVAIATRLYLQTPQNRIDPDWSRFIGYFIGDGCLCKNMTPSISNADRSVIDDIKFLSRKFGCSYSVWTERPTNDGRTFYALSFPRLKRDRLRNPINEALRKWGLYGQTKTDKIIPSEFMSANLESMRNLLAGLFASDGHVCRYIRKRDSLPVYSIAFTSCSFELCKQISMLLLYFGVQSTVHEKKQPASTSSAVIRTHPGICFQVAISAQESALNFIKEIPVKRFSEKYPQEMVVKDIGDRRSKLHGGTWTYNPKLKKSGYSKLPQHFSWLRVKSIKNCGTDTVFDLTVPTLHQYCAEGLISHNSSNGPILQSGTPGRKKCPFLSDIEYNLRKDSKAHLSVPYTDVIPFSEPYAAFVASEIERLPGGKQNTFFRMNYLLEWLLAVGRFVDSNLFLTFATSRRRSDADVLYGGIDWGKAGSSTTVTIMGREGTGKKVVDLLRLTDSSYDKQFEQLVPFLKKYFDRKMLKVASETNAAGAPNTERLQRIFGKARIVEYYTTASWKDKVFTELQTEIEGKNFSYFQDDSEEAIIFEKEFLDAEQEVRGNLLSVHKPDEEGASDDFLISTTNANALFPVKVIGSISGQSSGKKRGSISETRDY